MSEKCREWILGLLWDRIWKIHHSKWARCHFFSDTIPQNHFIRHSDAFRGKLRYVGDCLKLVLFPRNVQIRLWECAKILLHADLDTILSVFSIEFLEMTYFESQSVVKRSKGFHSNRIKSKTLILCRFFAIIERFTVHIPHPSPGTKYVVPA